MATGTIWGSTLKRKTPMRKTAFKRKEFIPGQKVKPALGKGKKTKAWEKTRSSLKERFKRAGITVCELVLPGCWRDNGLGFAHSLKRRNIKDDQLEEVVLACNSCHDVIEVKPESEMAEIVRAIIGRRGRL